MHNDWLQPLPVSTRTSPKRYEGEVYPTHPYVSGGETEACLDSLVLGFPPSYTLFILFFSDDFK